jgi:hypothetical protein
MKASLSRGRLLAKTAAKVGCHRLHGQARATWLHFTVGEGPGFMIHFTCDRCNRVIDLEQELRYVVRMEIEAFMDPIHEEEPQDDRDHLLEIDEILERAGCDTDESIGEDVYKKRRYDLCPQCYRKFKANPLAREKKPVTAMGFSHN